MYAVKAYNSGMERTCIFLTEPQRIRLREQADRSGIKVSELIRRYIDQGLDRDERKTKKES